MCRICRLDDATHVDCCDNLEYIPILPNLIRLEITNNKHIREIPILPNLKFLDIYNSKYILQLPVLPNLSTLRITMCYTNITVPIMPKLNCITYHGCGALRTITRQPNIKQLVIINCPGVNKIEKMDKLVILNITGIISTDILPEYPKKIKFPLLQNIECSGMVYRKLPINMIYLNGIPGPINIHYQYEISPVKNKLYKSRLRFLIRCQNRFRLKQKIKKMTYGYNPQYIIGYNYKKILEKLFS
jgi:hypothetical protein